MFIFYKSFLLNIFFPISFSPLKIYNNNKKLSNKNLQEKMKLISEKKYVIEFMYEFDNEKVRTKAI
jgi:hypothetical protein